MLVYSTDKEPTQISAFGHTKSSVFTEGYYMYSIYRHITEESQKSKPIGKVVLRNRKAGFDF
jgi:hypothetical protein